MTTPVEASADGDTVKKYELGGYAWSFQFPLPGILLLRLIGHSDNNAKATNAFLDIIDNAIVEEEREDFNKRLLAHPTIPAEDLNNLMEWLIEESAGNPTKS